MKGMLVALLVATAADTCCDAERHRIFQQQAEQATVCQAKGGIPITHLQTDDGGHAFLLLTNCAFPCDQRIAVEK